MTVRLRDVVSFLDTALDIGRFRDYCPNGLQVEARQEVTRIVTGVSANMALFEKAEDVGADLIVVHHGLIWGGGIPRVVGPTASRLKYLLSKGISLAAYHLPLDAHAELGNNAGLADALGLSAERETFGDVRGHALGVAGTYAEGLTQDEVVARLSAEVTGGEMPTFVFAHGPEVVRKVGLCTGAASDLLEEAVANGCDLFVTGELAERAGEMAHELQCTLVAAGHYCTEVFGPRRLATALAKQFPTVDVSFIAVPSPL